GFKIQCLRTCGFDSHPRYTENPINVNAYRVFTFLRAKNGNLYGTAFSRITLPILLDSQMLLSYFRSCPSICKRSVKPIHHFLVWMGCVRHTVGENIFFKGMDITSPIEKTK